MQTLVQYEDEMRDAYCARHLDVTKAEYMRNYPRGARLEEWRAYLWQCAESGETLPPVVLDRYTEHFGRVGFNQLHKFWPHAVPDGYLNPVARAEQGN